MSRARSALHMLAISVFWVTAAAADPVIRVDPGGFPELRVYLEAGDDSWAQAQATVAFGAEPKANLKQALDALAESRARSPGATDLPSLAEIPTNEVPAQIVPFDAQTHPGEGVLVIFLVDDSGSMPGKPIGRVIEVVEAFVAALRPQDRVAVIVFSTKTRILLQPTADGAQAVTVLKNLKPEGKVTHIYSGVNEAISTDLPSMQKSLGADFPRLPHRRFLFVFSDGRDEQSPVPVNDVLDKLGKLESRGLGVELLTIGVGQTSANHRDLQRLADVAALGPSKVQRFFDQPSPTEVVAAYTTLRDRLTEQLRVDFQLPVSYWLDAQIRAELRLTVGTDRLPPIAMVLTTGTLTIAQRERAQAHQAELAAVAAWHAQSDERQILLRTVGIIAACLALLVIIGLLIRRSFSKAREEQQVALANVNDDIRDQLRHVEGRIGQGEQALENQLQGLERRAQDKSRRALASLLSIEGPLKGRRYAITRSPCIAGRAADCDIVFPPETDRGMSRRHLEFRLDSMARWQVLCLAESGMGVNGAGVRHNDVYTLQIGDRIQCGSTVFRFDGPT